MANPSLAMIPSGYKDGTLYSPVPNTSVGDFDVSRGSLATRVNKNGLIETVGYEVGGNVVTNGDFSQGSQNWNLSSPWSIGDNKAVFNDSATNSFSQNGLSIVDGKSYKISFTIADCPTTAQVSMFDAGGNDVILANTNYANGSYTRYYTATTNETGISIWGNASGDTFSITNISIEEFAGEDVPRIDYTDGGCPVLLTEPQSTNKIDYSEDFSNAAWTKTGASVLGGQASPSADSPLGAFKLVEDTSNGNHRLYVIPTTLAEGSLSLFAKANGRTEISLVALVNNATFDLSNGTVLSETSQSNAKIQSFGNGWFRCSIVAPILTGNSANIYMSENEDITYQGDGTSGVYIFGAQLEELPYATSYIPTNGGTATRLGESVTGAGDASTFNDSEGVLFAEISALENGVSDKYISLSDGGSQNQIQIILHTTLNRIIFRITSSGVVGVNLSNLDFDQTDDLKIAAKYKANDFALWINGAEQVATTVGDLASSIDRLGLDFGNGGLPFFGKTSQVQVFNTALSDAELQILTTI